MTLSTLLLIIAALAFMLTLVVGLLYKKHHSWTMTFLQNFTGVLFVISGYVKAIDPLGTAYKMEQYFAELESTMESTAVSFLAPVFPFLNENAVTFSVCIIVIEIVIGVMLIFGHRSKFTSWVFLIMVGVFTFLTGFTYLTGHVPDGVNFFAFSGWGPYDELQMKVTDCGCFGDFLKLEPKVSFLKDLVLLVPAIFFVFRHRDMHELFSAKTRSWVLGILTLALIAYCFRNFSWNIPHADFRPFKQAVDIREQKAIEEEAEANVQIINYTLQNKLTGKYQVLPYEQYLKEYRNYPKTDWDIVGQERTEPTVEKTKISDFIIYDMEDNDITNEILSEETPSFMFVCHKVYYSGSQLRKIEYIDSTLQIDTLIEGGDTTLQEYYVEDKGTRNVMDYNWNVRFVKRFNEVINPLAREGLKQGVRSFAVFGGADQEMLASLREAADIDFPVYTADDILLKTIVRSNPGIVLMEDGKILQKWHYKRVPSFEEIKDEFLK
ncbi:MAG: hypothetical protein OEQ53_00070 [Saprospiraceae bacterium]|nr:hypothetical protein [Saprospiraceae bacterium]